MDMQEFHSKVRKSETDHNCLFDVRPFELRQGEAIESYLLARRNVFEPPTNKPLVIQHDADARVSDDVWNRWKEWAKALEITFDPGWSPIVTGSLIY